jgi:hypothetical protein
MRHLRLGLEGVMVPVNRLSWQVRIGLLMFLLLLTYDGALRKWIFPGSEQFVFVLKDILLVFLTCAVFLFRSNSVYLPYYAANSFLFYALWVVLGLFNPGAPNLWVSIWGLKAHLLYAVFILLLPIVFITAEHALQQLERLYSAVVIPVSAIAIVQVGLDADSAINQQVRGGLEGISYFGEESLVRVAGTFSYISGMAAFVQFSALIGVGLFLAGCRSRWFLLGLAAAAAVLPVTGSRAVVYVVAVGTALLVAAAVRANLIRGRQLIYVVGLISTVMAVGIFAQSDAWAALQQRMDANRVEGAQRIVSAFTNAFSYAATAGLEGYGTGTANLGAVALSGDVQPFSWFPVGTGFEEESGRIVLELGLVGWLVSLTMRVSLLVWSIRLVFIGRTKPIRSIGMLALPFMAFGVHTGNGVFAASYMAAGYWFVVGLMAVAQRDARRLRKIAPVPVKQGLLP